MTNSELMILDGVLIVDDCPVMTHTLSSFLVSNGYNVVGTAADGIDAIKMVKEHKPAIILMDLNMPRLDGYNAIAAVKKISEDIKIIVVSAESEKANVILAMKAGADEFMAKPLNPKTLIDVINKIEFGDYNDPA